jgi:hypothetical protein
MAILPDDVGSQHGRRRRRLRRPVLPRVERALGQRERGAELTRGDAMIAVDSVERADELAGMSARY